MLDNCYISLNANSTIQTLTSPGFPIYYPNGAFYDCQYVISAPYGKTVVLQFNDTMSVLDPSNTYLRVQKNQLSFFS